MKKIGIQGGAGSYNELALKAYAQQASLNDLEILYLETTDRVLEALVKQEVDYGQFAISNSVSGPVKESENALSAYDATAFNTVREYDLPATFCLFAYHGAPIEQITTIMSHPQAFAECSKYLAEKYPNVTLVTGPDQLIDPSTAATALSEGKLSPTTAVLAGPNIAAHDNLTVLDHNLQDDDNNITTFRLITLASAQVTEH